MRKSLHFVCSNIQFKWSNIYFSFWQVKAESHCWFGLNIQVPGGKITPMKILPNISAYVSLKDFTTDLIFLHRYICHICEFCNSVRCKSLLVWFKCTGARGKITQMKVLPNISTYVTLPIFYPRPPKLLHRYICRFCDILLLCKVG